MINIFTLQWQRLRRKPFMVLAMVAMTIVFIIFIGGANNQSEVSVPISFTEGVSEAERTKLADQLNELDGFRFIETNEDKARENIALGVSSFGITLAEENYRFIIGTENPNQAIVEQYISSMYWEKLRIEQAVGPEGDEHLRRTIEASLEDPSMDVVSQIGESEGDVFIYNNKLQALFGMTLFFAIYTIVFGLGEVAEEKQRGSWDRLILSPVRKWQIYLGYLSFAFVIGMVQIFAVFTMFHFFFGFDMGGRWLEIFIICLVYTFAIVSLGMLIIGLVNRSSQLNAVVPIIAVSMAMLGGAYWPIEIVNNEVVLAISKVIPVTHAMEALKAITVYGKGLADIAQPLSILLLMGVLCMGCGINLMERR
ncbi:ABC-2 type transport system permease protein [Gracilibacillus ureilyticus]|uniref:ABC-2 type transport system permease protein n=1 Tax=Gracilibacillus ureilyticus TaxID=531814 RepID=A0A1H9MV03_9BACI|nr:ABC transporter permease [Gracilibacillus ureilyticus]SER27512.1 ABC-2 type transport system permease protein [Gracilibacillus ureilyticus]